MTKGDLERLIRLRNTLTMGNASFRSPEDGFPSREGENWPATDDRFTAAVRKQTLNWRNTWIFPTLDALIRKYDPDGVMQRQIAGRGV